MKTTKMLNDKVIKSIVLGLSASMVLTPVTSIVTSVEALADEGETKEEKTEEKKEASEDKDSSEDNYKVDKEEESKDEAKEESKEESKSEESKSEESAPAPAAEESAPAAEESAPAAKEESAPAAEEKKESSSKSDDAEEVADETSESTADYSSVPTETVVEESFKVVALSEDDKEVKYVDVDVDTLSITKDELAELKYDENGVAEWYDAKNDKTYVITKTETTTVVEKDKAVDDAELLKKIADAAKATGSNTVTIDGKIYTYNPGTADTEEDADFEEVGIDPTDADLTYDEDGKATKVVDGVTYIITRVVDTEATQVTDATLLAQIAAQAAATGSNTVVINNVTYTYVPGTPTTYPSAVVADLSVDAGSLTYDGDNKTTWVDTDGTKYIITKSVVKKKDFVAVTDEATLEKIRAAVKESGKDASNGITIRVDGITYTYKQEAGAWTEPLGEVDVDSINGLDKTTLNEGENTYTDTETGIKYTITKTTSSVDNDSTTDVTDEKLLNQIKDAAEGIEPNSDGTVTVTVGGVTYTYTPSVTVELDDYATVDDVEVDPASLTYDENNEATWTDPTTGVTYTFTKTVTQNPPVEMTVTSADTLAAIRTAAQSVALNEDGVTKTVTVGGVEYTYTPSVDEATTDYLTFTNKAYAATLTYDENNEAKATIDGVTYTFKKTTTPSTEYDIAVSDADILAAIRTAAQSVALNEDGVTKTVTVGGVEYTYTPSVDEATTDYLTFTDKAYAATLTYDENNEATATIDGVTYTFKKTTTPSTEYDIAVSDADTLAAIRTAAQSVALNADGTKTVTVGGVEYTYTPSVDEATTDYLTFTDKAFAATLTYDVDGKATATIDGVTYTFQKTTTPSTEYNKTVDDADTLAAIRRAAESVELNADGVTKTVTVGGVEYTYTPSVDEATEDYKTISDAKVDPKSLTYDENGVATWTDEDGVTYTFKKTTEESTEKNLSADATLLAKIRTAAENVAENADGTKTVVIDGVTYKYTPKKTVSSEASLELSKINVDPKTLTYDANGEAKWTDPATGVTYTFKKTTETSVEKNLSVDTNSNLMNQIRKAAAKVALNADGTKTVVVGGITYTYTPGKEETKVSDTTKWLESISGYNTISLGDTDLNGNHINGSVIVCGTLKDHNNVIDNNLPDGGQTSGGTVSKIQAADENWGAARVYNENGNGGQVAVNAPGYHYNDVSAYNQTDITYSGTLQDITASTAEAIKTDIIAKYNAIVSNFKDGAKSYTENGITYKLVTSAYDVNSDWYGNTVISDGAKGELKQYGIGEAKTYKLNGGRVADVNTVYVVASNIKNIITSQLVSMVLAPFTNVTVSGGESYGTVIGNNVTVCGTQTHTGVLKYKEDKKTTPDSAVYDKTTYTDKYEAKGATEQTDDSAKYDKTTYTDKYEATGSTKKTQDAAKYDETTYSDDYEAIGSTQKTQDAAKYDETTYSDDYEAIGSTQKTQDAAKYDETTYSDDYEAIGSTRKTVDSAKYDLVTEDVEYESTSASEQTKHSAVFTGKHDEVSYSAVASKEHEYDPEVATTDEEWDYSAVKEVEGESDSASYYGSEYSGIKVIKGESDSAKYDLTEKSVSYAAKTTEEEEETNPPEDNPEEPSTPDTPKKKTTKKKETKKTSKKKSTDNEESTPPYETPSVSVLGEVAAPEAGVLGELAAPEAGVLGELEAPETGDDGYLAVFGEVAAALAMVGVGISLTKKKEEE